MLGTQAAWEEQMHYRPIAPLLWPSLVTSSAIQAAVT